MKPNASLGNGSPRTHASRMAPPASGRIGSYTYSDMAELDDLWAQVEAGDDKMQFTLGVGFDNGRGVKKDEAEAVILEPRLLGK